MKKILLITLLSLATLAKAQTSKPIDGFLGIKFGSTQAQVIEAIKAKGGEQDEDFKAPGPLAFGNIQLGDRKAYGLLVSFINNQAYEAQFIFSPSPETKVVEYYNALVKDISEVYGAGKSTRKFQSPYQDGDGYEITALKSGNADFQTFWHVGENYIMAKIVLDDNDKTLDVRLYYEDGKLFQLHKDQQKSQNKSEF